MLIFVIKL